MAYRVEIARNAEQALTRLAHCVLTANVGLPHRSTREAITLAIHLVVHLARLESRRAVTDVVRVRGYDPQSDRFVVEPWCLERAVREGATV
jgi:Flp pilus assembly CpaF family ATPase